MSLPYTHVSEQGAPPVSYTRRLRGLRDDDPVVLGLARAIAHAQAVLRDEPPPVFDLLPEADRVALRRAAVRVLRGLQPEVRTAARFRATSPPLTFDPEARARDASLMAWALDTFEAALDGVLLEGGR